MRLIEGGRKVADAILARAQKSREENSFNSQAQAKEIYTRKGSIEVKLIEAEELVKSQQSAFIEQESKRCLECSYVCSKCVDVCPNRANISLPIPGFKDELQVLHIDAFCNECGNCAQFCPWDSKPYKDKFTIFNLREDFDNSTNEGFYVQGKDILLRVAGESQLYPMDTQGMVSLPESMKNEATMINYVLSQHSYLLGQVEA
ncbi:hypothetical protein ACLKMH_09900 [Psychromonas sp. KJ10-10]|uniref:hypothetical protein n=1 Tax=Psychromonas sp. KJ10-10 TaxID=3391823 RepID=UPI0039B69962